MTDDYLSASEFGVEHASRTFADAATAAGHEGVRIPDAQVRRAMHSRGFEGPDVPQAMPSCTSRSTRRVCVSRTPWRRRVSVIDTRSSRSTQATRTA
jgi:hypothetical protein